jgi:hypothetical protein
MLRAWGSGAANGLGTALFTSGSATVTGTGTNWTANMVGGKIALPGTNNPIYTIATRTSTTSITISPAYAGATTASVPYAIWNPPANWPNITATNFAGAWCANCHRVGSTTYHGGNHTGEYCYECHIMIPHGGKMSRLLMDADTTPYRYCYNGTRASGSMLNGITKTTYNGYAESNCTGCGRHTGGAENW